DLATMLDVQPTPTIRLRVWLVLSKPEGPILIHWHGNGELASETAQNKKGWAMDRGVNLCCAEFRG
ncbi:hypothetical protein KIPB_017112, partial [Kipferlia bialata]